MVARKVFLIMLLMPAINMNLDTVFLVGMVITIRTLFMLIKLVQGKDMAFQEIFLSLYLSIET